MNIDIVLKTLSEVIIVLLDYINPAQWALFYIAARHHYFIKNNSGSVKEVKGLPLTKSLWNISYSAVLGNITLISNLKIMRTEGMDYERCLLISYIFVVLIMIYGYGSIHRRVFKQLEPGSRERENFKRGYAKVVIENVIVFGLAFLVFNALGYGFFFFDKATAMIR